MDKIIYYIDPETNEIIKGKYVESLSKSDYRVVIRDDGDVIAIPMGAAMIFSTEEEALEYKAGYYFVPMDGQNIEYYKNKTITENVPQDNKELPVIDVNIPDHRFDY